MNRFDNIDCMIGMKEYPDKYFDLAIVDPPYGINMSERINTVTGGTRFLSKDWDSSTPNKDYFDELKRVSKNQIIWGGNYFIEHLSNTPCFLIWDKNNGDSLFADGELAWTSFNTPLRIKKVHWCGSAAIHETGQNKIHPTQKPIALYKWLLTKYAKPNDKILDTHVGSASSLIACEDLGFEYVGFELDKDYFAAANKRLDQFRSQLKLAI